MKHAKMELIGKQKNLDRNKNGKIDSEDLRMIRENRMMADGGMMAKGSFLGKGEMVWKKLTSSKKMEFLYDNFTPEITPRGQELLVGKAYNFLPKNVKIKFEAKYANVEEYGVAMQEGGSMATGGEIRRFNRHKNMDMDTLDEIGDIIKEVRFDDSNLSNSLFGLYDGYDYSQEDWFKEKMAKLKSENPQLHKRIQNVYAKVSKYPSGITQVAEGGSMAEGGEMKNKLFIGYEDWNHPETKTFTKYFIEPYDKSIEWHNGKDIFRGTQDEVKEAEESFYKNREEEGSIDGGGKGSEFMFWAGLLGWGVLSYIGINKK